MRFLCKRAGIVVALLMLVAAGNARAELFSKAYAFKVGTTLEIGTEMPGGLRLDSVEFEIPDPAVQGSVWSGPKAKVAISNLGTSSVKIAVSIAVTDAEGKLVGVASGGTKLFPMRADRAIVYSLPINGVRSEFANGTVFRISVEPAP
jgi:hypothetical protein